MTLKWAGKQFCLMISLFIYLFIHLFFPETDLWRNSNSWSCICFAVWFCGLWELIFLFHSRNFITHWTCRGVMHLLISWVLIFVQVNEASVMHMKLFFLWTFFCVNPQPLSSNCALDFSVCYLFNKQLRMKNKRGTGTISTGRMRLYYLFIFIDILLVKIIICNNNPECDCSVFWTLEIIFKLTVSGRGEMM